MTVSDGLDFIAGIFSAGAFLIALAIYTPTVVCTWFAIKRLRRNYRDPIGYALIAGALVVPAAFAIPFFLDEMKLEARAAEVASWPRMVPDPFPRNLVIHARRADPDEADYALELAESGLFEVYLVTSRSRWKAELLERKDCAELRHDRIRFTAMTGFRRCAQLVKIDQVPDDGLVLYEGAWNAPLASREFDRPGDSFRRVNWAIQLSYGKDGKEELIAYEESIKKKNVHRFGILVVPGLEEQPMRQVTSGSRTTYFPDPAKFIYKHLGIDPTTVRPASTIDSGELQESVANLLAKGDKKSAKAIARLAAMTPGKEKVLADALRTITSSPELRGSLWEGPIDCGYAHGLGRYVREIGEGCEAGPWKSIDRCGAFSSLDDWYLICEPNKSPAWLPTDGGKTRVIIDGLFSSLKADITTAKRYRYRQSVKEIVVPADRGLIDLVVHGEGVWHLAGSPSCLASVTVVASDAGVIGMPSEKVRFIGPPDHAYVADGYNAARGTLTPRMRETLGAEPDVAIFDHREDVVGLGTFIPAGGARESCPLGPTVQPLPVTSDATVVLDIDEIVLPPLAVPVHYREK